MDTKSSSYEKRARVDLLDLKDQSEGEAHIFFRSKIVRARMFYANPTPVAKLKLNQFLKVEPPSDVYLSKLNQQLEQFKIVLESNDWSMQPKESREEIEAITQILTSSEVEDPIERAVGGLIAFYKRNQPEEVEEILQEVVSGELTIFSPLDYPTGLPRLRVTDERFVMPLLPINETRNDLMLIEQYSGEKEKLAGTIANEIIKDLQASTGYPPQHRNMLETSLIIDSINTICTRIREEREALN